MDEYRQAFEFSLRILARRDHSVEELRRKLRSKCCNETVLQETIDRLTGQGLLDDRRFARRWAESAIQNGRGYGPRIFLELARRGVTAEILEGVLAEVGRDFEESEALSSVMTRKFPNFPHSDITEKEKRRVVAYLQRRGFSIGTIFNYINGSYDRDR